MATKHVFFIAAIFIALSYSCKKEENKWNPKDPDSAPIISIDRFSDQAGNLMKRSENPELPEANTAINFDNEPFITQSFGPEGQVVKYYNFDMQPLPPIPVYVLVYADNKEVPNQLSIFDVVPGELTYNDFWQMYMVRVPDDYQANSITSYKGIIDAGLSIEKTLDIVNCPIIPEGSTANLRLSDETNDILQAWCRDSIVYYFTFMEKVLKADEIGLTPVSDIFVCFNKNPDTNDPTSGPASGFVKEAGSNQTHNVISTIPEDEDYSALWTVQIYNNSYFDRVSDLESVKKAEIVMPDGGFVNCPVVFIAD